MFSLKITRIGDKVVSPPTASELLESLRKLVQLARVRAIHSVHLGMLPPPLGALLSHLEYSKGCRPSTVAEYLQVTPSTLSRQLAHAESLGYVVRFADPADKRASLVSLSETGVQALQAHRAVQLNWILSAVTEWTEEEVQQLTARLDRLGDAVQAEFAAHASAPRKLSNSAAAAKSDRVKYPEVG